MDELWRKLKTDLTGEINDVKGYATLAKMARDSGNDCEAQILRDMAWEEHTHAKHLMHILNRHGVAYNELVPAYDDAMEILRNA